MKTAALLLSFCTLAVGQEPKLEPAFKDDFSKDTRSDYTVKGDVNWEAGKLTLPEGAWLERAVNGGPWAKVTLQLRPVELNEDQPQSELRIWFMLDGATPCYLRLRRASKAGRAATSIALVDTGKVVREVILTEEKLGDGSVEYREGLVRVVFPGKVSFAAYTPKGGAGIRSLKFVAKKMDHGLVSLTATTSKKLRKYAPKGRSYTAADKKQMAKADAARRKLVNLHRAGKFAEAAKNRRTGAKDPEVGAG